MFQLKVAKMTETRKVGIQKLNETLRLRNVHVETRFLPKRRIILSSDKIKRVTYAVLGSSLVYGIFLPDSVTVSCPGGTLSTLCSDQVLNDMKNLDVQTVLIMGGTNNLFDRSGRQSLGATEVAEEMESAIFRLLDCNFEVGVMSLISREGERSLIRRVNKCYRNLTAWYKILLFKTVKFSNRRHVCADGLHPTANGVRELAKDFHDAFRSIENPMAVKRRQRRRRR